jgi:hypothetical protein
MSYFVPTGYQPIAEWVDAEIERRGQRDAKEDLQTRLAAFGDLANFLGHDENEKKGLALGFDAAGKEIKIYASDWRSERRESLLYQLMPELPLDAPFRTKTRIFLRNDLRLGEGAESPAEAEKAISPRGRGGRPPKWDIAAGVGAAWAEIYGDRKTANGLNTVQACADLIKSKLARGNDEEPSDATVWPYAKQMLELLRKG